MRERISIDRGKEAEGARSAEMVAGYKKDAEAGFAIARGEPGSEDRTLDYLASRLPTPRQARGRQLDPSLS